VTRSDLGDLGTTTMQTRLYSSRLVVDLSLKRHVSLVHFTGIGSGRATRARLSSLQLLPSWPNEQLYMSKYSVHPGNYDSSDVRLSWLLSNTERKTDVSNEIVLDRVLRYVLLT
jgi:hypothetical protein